MDECTDEDDQGGRNQVVVKMMYAWSTTNTVTPPPPGGLEVNGSDGEVSGSSSGTEIASSSAALNQDLNSAPSCWTVSDMPPVYNQADYLSFIVSKDGRSLVQVKVEPPQIKEESSSPSVVTLVQVKVEPEEQEEEPLQRPQEAERLILTSCGLRPTSGSGYVRRMEYTEFPRPPVCSTDHEERSTSSVVQRGPEPPQAAGSSSLTLPLAAETEEDDESREREPVAAGSTSTEHPKTQDDAEDCGASQPTSDDRLLSSRSSDKNIAGSSGDENMQEDESAFNKPNSHQKQNVEGRLSARKEQSQGQRSSKQTPSTTSGTGKKCFTCTECGKVFGRPSQLKRHTRTTLVCSQATECKSLKSMAPKVVRRHRTGQRKNRPPHEDGSPHLSGVQTIEEAAVRSSDTRPSDEEDETDDDEEWTPGLSGDKVLKAVPVRSGKRTFRKRRDDINYKEPEVPEDDNFYFCDRCGEFFLKECDKHGEPDLREDFQVALPETDRARQTLPRGFEIKQSGIPNAGLGVFYCGPSKKLAAGTHFGPYVGVKTGKEEAVESGYSWVIRRKRGHYDYIDAKDETRSNWMRYVNCARNEREQNLIAFQHRGRVLYRCCRPVKRGEELLVWYGDEYAKELGIVFDELWDNKCSATGVSSKSSQTEIFSCSECTYAFTSKLFLHKHIKRSHNDLYWQMVRNGQISTASQKQGDTDKPRPYNQKQFTETTTQTADVKTQQLPGTGKLTHACNQCDKGFNQSRDLKRLMRLHTGEKPYACEQCGKTFSRLDNLKIHMRLHTGEKPYACEQCGKGFNQSGDLKRHVRLHTGEKPYACEQCGKSFNLSGALKRHVRLHTGEKPYACEQCGKSFNLSGNLKKHMCLHTGEKPYACEQCGKSFNLSGNLKKHMCLHTGEKPYACEQCGKTFNRLDNLKSHMRLHTGEKPYACEQCGKGFNQSGNLKKHMRLHTGEKPYALLSIQ